MLCVPSGGGGRACAEYGRDQRKGRRVIFVTGLSGVLRVSTLRGVFRKFLIGGAASALTQQEERTGGDRQRQRECRGYGLAGLLGAEASVTVRRTDDLD